MRSKSNYCYTCNAYVEGKNKQAGHWISRQHFSTRWDERNVRTQCFRCNIWLRGNSAAYAGNLLEELGEKEFKALIQRGKEIKQWSVKELEELIKKYETD